MKSLESKFTLVILGRSGSGKGTQAKFLVRRLQKQGVSYVGTGEILRILVRKYRNPTIDIARRIMRGGKLFPAWFPAYAWLKEFIENGMAANHIVFDGAARRVWEAKLLDDVVAAHRRSLPLVILVDVGEREAMRRLLARGRSDDKPPKIKNRLAFFGRYVSPVIRYYRSRGRLIRVNGEQSVKNVWKEIDAQLKKRLGKKWPSP